VTTSTTTASTTEKIISESVQDNKIQEIKNQEKKEHRNTKGSIGTKGRKNGGQGYITKENVTILAVSKNKSTPQKNTTTPQKNTTANLRP